MNKQTKYLIGLVIFLIAVVGFIQYISRNKQALPIPDAQNREVVIPNDANVSPTNVFKGEIVSIDFGNGKTIEGRVIVQNAYQALLQVAKEKNLPVEAKQYKYGVLVTKIGGVANSDKAGWNYWVNGKMGQIASDRYIVYPGDKVLWKFANF